MYRCFFVHLLSECPKNVSVQWLNFDTTIQGKDKIIVVKSIDYSDSEEHISASSIEVLINYSDGEGHNLSGCPLYKTFHMV